MIFALGIGLSTVSSPVFAHHGNAAYDTEKRLTLKGTVIRWIWSNPHCILQLDVTDDSKQVVHWVADTENPSSMARQGWTDQTLKPGDQVTVTVMTVKNGDPVGRIGELVLPNGQKLLGRGTAAEPPKPEDSPKQ
jgi:hypothetical protein